MQYPMDVSRSVRKWMVVSSVVWGLGLTAHGPIPFQSASAVWATEPGDSTRGGWSPTAPRKEIRPDFAFAPTGGHAHQPVWTIQADQREGLDGYWTRRLPVDGGKWYRFQAYRRLAHVASARRSAVVRILWRDAQGRQVPVDRLVVDFYRGGGISYAQAEYPRDGVADDDGWTLVEGIYRVPPKAGQAIIEMHLRWAPGGRADWSDVQLVESPPARPRKVRLATIHFRPTGGKTPAGNCRLFAPLIAQAAARKADLVVLPETLTFYGTRLSYVEAAEPIPGPSTEYFGKLAAAHNLYLVVGLLERDQHLVYNTAVLIGPDGKVVGKYRKVCLPRGEIEGGITPGHDYPVFATRFGKVGMMICYDGFFPEVARELSNHGAEVIAWPVWGCNPLLAQARAAENHVYLVSSTYTDASQHWIRSAIYDHTGTARAAADKWGEVVVVEVDLNEPTVWSGIGDFKAELDHHRPLPASER